MIKKFLLELFLGKETVEEVQVGRAKATITDEDGQIFTITREGYAQRVWETNWVHSGLNLLQAYMSEGKRQVLVDDSGRMVPVCRIKKIDVEELPYAYRLRYLK